jgi:hypothetical protein
MPQKFNQIFNQNSTIKSSTANLFSCFPTILEEGTSEVSDEEDTLSESDKDKFEFEAHSEVDTEEAENETTFTGISCISEERGQAFSAWRSYIPPAPVL